MAKSGIHVVPLQSLKSSTCSASISGLVITMGSVEKLVGIGFPSTVFGVKEGALAVIAIPNPLKMSVISFYKHINKRMNE